MDVSINLTLVEAWSIWLEGENVQSYFLWGESIRFWGRLGALLQFLAALTILAEIVGPAPFRSFSNRLSVRFSWQQVEKLMNLPYRAFENIIAHETADYIDRKQDPLLYWTGIAVFWSTVIFYLWSLIHFTEEYGFFAFLLYLIGWWVLVPIYFYVTISLVSALIFCLIFFVEVILLGPIIWILEKDSIEMEVKVLSAMALVVGFHFDFLAS